MFFLSCRLGGMGGGESTQATDFWGRVGGKNGGCGAGRLTKGVILIPVFI